MKEVSNLHQLSFRLSLEDRSDVLLINSLFPAPIYNKSQYESFRPFDLRD